MKLTHKARLRSAILHQPVDYLPTQVNYTARMGERMAAHFGVELTELPIFLGNHIRRVDLDFVDVINSERRLKFDWWGAGHDTGEEGYFISLSPLAESKDLDKYRWPDPGAAGLLDSANRVIQEAGSEYFIVPNFGWALFERAWSLRGLQQLFMDMVVDPGYVYELLDRITAIQLVLIERFIQAGVDGAYFGDDYGAQKNLLFSPKMWRNFIKPRLARLFEPFIQQGLPIIMHSDGQIQEILPDLVEIGLSTLNPVQPEVLDHHWLWDNFSGQLSFFGGISTQTILPRGGASEVQQAVLDCQGILARNHTGLVIGPSHRMMVDIPMSNVEAMLGMFQQLRDNLAG